MTKPTGRPKGGSQPHIYGGVPEPILISERIACDLFAGMGVNRRTLRTWIDGGAIFRRRLIVGGVEREGLLYQELLVLAQNLPLMRPDE